MAICWSTNNGSRAPRQTRVTAIQLNRRPVTFGIPMPDSTPVPRHSQWPFQEPKLEVPTIYKAYFLGLCKGISPQNMALYGTNVPPI